MARSCEEAQLELADPDALAALRADRDLVAQQVGFTEAWERLNQFGFTTETSEEEIESALDSSGLIDSALASRDVLESDNATDDEREAGSAASRSRPAWHDVLHACALLDCGPRDRLTAKAPEP